MDNELPLTKQTPLPPPAPVGELSLSAIADRILTGEITNEKLAMIKDLVKMDAERAFAVAFVGLQAKLPVIVAKTPIPNRGKYEKFEDLMDVVGPLLKEFEFTASFSNDFRDGRIIETCRLQHVKGHFTENRFAVRTRKADNDTQADCMAATTAKRNALCNALNIVIRQDCLTEENDPRMESDQFVTKEQAAELERRVKEKNRDVQQFLLYAGAKSFDKIPASMFEDLDAMLTRAKAL